MGDASPAPVRCRVGRQLCKNCGKPKGVHRAKDLACPFGRRGVLGYLAFHLNNFYTPPNAKDQPAGANPVPPTK